MKISPKKYLKKNHGHIAPVYLCLLFKFSFARSSKASPAVLVIGGRNSDTMDSIPLKNFKEEKLIFSDSCPEFLDILESAKLKSIGKYYIYSYILLECIFNRLHCMCKVYLGNIKNQGTGITHWFRTFLYIYIFSRFHS